MNCAELEILICDYVDGTLGPDARTRSSSTWPSAEIAPNWRGMPPPPWDSWSGRPKWSRRRN